MSPPDILALVRARPFVPFHVTLTDGTVYDVRKPYHCMVGVHEITVGIEHRRRPGLCERAVRVSHESIARVEQVPPS